VSYKLEKLEDSLKIRLVRVVAEGGMGTVYEGLLEGPEGFEKRVCVKTIKEKFARSVPFLKRFVLEAKLVADLVHQNIIQIYKLGRSGSDTYILMEYVHGVTLQKFMKTHAEMSLPIPAELAAFICSRICRGLEYAHGRKSPDGKPLGIVHRDISPKNVMLSAEGEVKLTDFGVAKAALLKEREGEVLVGKLTYMSPEQAQGMPTDHRSDIFSVGVILYEMLSLRKLFDPRNETSVIVREICEKEIPDLSRLNPEIPLALAAVVRRSLERDPWKRFPDAGEMGYDLEYLMYKKGFGPTILSLETYLRQLFPDLYAEPQGEKP
jgi:serine/threonine-protein kinase